MKKLQVVLGENEAQITMEFDEQIAAQFFKEMSDRMFAEKYNISSVLAKECGATDAEEQIVEEVPVSEEAPSVVHKPVADHTEDTMETLMSLVDESIKAMNHKEEVEDRVYHLKIEKPSLALFKCKECNGKFFASAKKGDKVSCRCGADIDTNKTFARGAYSCKRCMNEFIFFADETIDKHDSKCTGCGAQIKLKFDKSRYQLNNY